MVNNREGTVQQMAKQLDEELGILHQNLAIEKRAREEGEEALLDFLREIVAKSKTEMDKNKKEREENEQQLMELLDKTCTKLKYAAQY